LDTDAVYEGQWLGKARDGHGKQVWPDGSRYEGEWRMTKLMARGNYFTPTETFTKVIGSTIRRMASAPTLMLMGPSTWVTGKTISKMAMVMRRGLMALFTKASTKMERSMVLAS